MRKTKKLFSVLTTAFVITSLFGSIGIPKTNAALSQIGPVNATTTFPAWYQDSTGLTLELMEAADVRGISAAVDPTNQFSQQIGFGEEGFWFSADANMPTSAGQALLVQALEASFAPATTPTDGLQSAFSRIRIRVDVAEPGEYTVIYPYGQKTYTVTATGTRAINDTIDIGCFSDPTTNFRCDTAIAPNDFSAALTGDIGPFLTWDTFNIDPLQSDPLLADAVTGKRYIGLSTTPHAIKGSPTGNNIFRIEGPSIGGQGIDAVETNLFTVTGRLVTVDTTAPVITINGANPLNLSVGQTYTEPGATALDNIDGTVPVTITGTVNTTTTGSYIITYSATDAAGNSATTTRTVNVSANPQGDTIPPVITINGANPAEITIGSVYIDAGATATDNIDPIVTVSSTSTVNTSTIGTYTVIYTATDTAGNSTSSTRTVNVVAATPADIISPVITLLGQNPISLNIGETYTDAGATAQDETSGELTANITITGLPIDINNAGTYTVTYSVSDAAGNQSNLTRTVHVLNPVTGSIVNRSFSSQSPAAGTPLNVSLSVNLVSPDTFYIIDEIVPEGWIISNPGTGDTTQPGHIKWFVLLNATSTVYQYTVTVPENATGTATFAGEYGFDSTPAGTQVAGQTTVTISPATPIDTTAPVITLNGAAVMQVTQGSIFIDPGATASDNSDPVISVITANPVDTNIIGSYTITYTATDSSGNTATPVFRTVNVVAAPTIDTIDPVITLIGNAVININLSDAFTDPGVTAADETDGNITNQVQTTGTVNTAVAGAYTINYTVSDAAGNSTTVSRIINVNEIIPTPIIDRIHVNPDLATTTIGSTVQFTAEARDINNNPIPGITFTWSMKDNDTSVGNIDNAGLFTAIANGTASIVVTANNASSTADIIVNEIILPPTDTTNPIINLIGSNPFNLTVGATFIDPGATATDETDGNITNRVQVTGTVNTQIAGIYTVTYSVSDNAGNSATTARTVNVTAIEPPPVVTTDTIAPVITITGDNPLNILIGSEFNDPGATASDNKDGNLTNKINANDNVKENEVGTYTVTYKVKDAAGNEAIATRTVKVNTPTIVTVLGGGSWSGYASGQSSSGSGSNNNSQSSNNQSSASDNSSKPAGNSQNSDNSNNNQANGSVAGVQTFRFNRDLKQGMSGEDVKELQQKLKSEGLFNGPVTGFFGTLTQKAVKEMQKKNGIINTGFVGPLTRSKLNGSMVAGASTSTAISKPTVASLENQLTQLLEKLQQMLQQIR